MSQKQEILKDEAYAEFMEADGFKEIIKNISTYTLDEFKTACDLAFAKEMKMRKTFSKEQKEVKTIAFALNNNETKNSFLDSLLRK
jgi:hypothetical protein